MVKIISVLLFFFVSNAFAGIRVIADKTQISSIEQLQVSISVDNLSGSQQLDISALQADFKIVNQSKSSVFSSINGRSSSTLNLKLTLTPKRVGKLIIPAFKIAGQMSKAIKIQVNKVDQRSFENNIIFIKTSVDNTNPMVQQQVIYTVSLYSRSNIKTTKLNFTPQIADAKVKKILDSSSNKTKFKGKNLWKKDFNFAIYPQKIGKLSIPNIKLPVRVNQSNVLLFASSSDLNVLPSNINYPSGQYWLPATDVKLSQRAFDKSQKIIAGEPISRQILIKVSGQSAEQVPLISLPSNASMEQYADKISNSEELTNTNIISTIEQNILLIANQSGEQTLPEMTLTWFDVDDNKTKIARIPATKIMVIAPRIQPKTLVLPKLADKDIHLSSTQTKPPASQPTYWRDVAIFAIILWLMSVLLCWSYQQYSTKKVKKSKKTDNDNPLKMIKKYAEKNNTAKTKQALDAWVFQQYGLLDTNSFAQQLGDNFAAEVLILQQNLYKSGTNWNGKKFYQVLALSIKNHTSKKHKQGLSDLYPKL